MDVQFFLKERTRFIRHYYDTAAEPFRETMRRVEAGEAPFDNPPYSEDGEPPFLEEWSQAATALEILGRTCVSMLSASLQLYFMTWESELGVAWDEGERKRAFRDGLLGGYKKCFSGLPGLSWADCPADLAVLEQVTLARNRDQHPESITSMRVNHSPSDRSKYPQPYFVSDDERRMMLAAPEMAEVPWMSPAVHVSRDGLFAAIEQVEILAGWLEERIHAFRQGP